MRYVSCLLTAGLLAATGPAVAQAPGRGEEAGTRDRTGERSFRGILHETRDVRAQDTGERHLLGVIETDSGATIVADFGPIARLRDARARLQRDRRVEIAGRSGRMNREPVIVVYRFSIPDDERSVAKTPSETRERPARRRATRGASGRRVITGEVLGIRSVRLAGTDHELLRMKTRDGRTVVADLGSGEALQDLALERGDRVVVLGATSRIDGTPVIVASSVGELVRIERPRRPSRDRAGRETTARFDERSRRGGSVKRQGTAMTVSGTIDEYRRVNVPGFSEKQTLIRLRLENGRVVTVNFDPNVDPAQLDLEKGDRVTVRGRKTYVDGKALLQARSFRIVLR